MPRDYTVTGEFVYLRFHGLKDGAYHDYTRAELDPWAKQLRRAAERGLPCYAYFNNDLNTRAPINAETLMEMAGPHVVPAFGATRATALEIKAPTKKPETWRPWTRKSRSRKSEVRSRRVR
jgi:uncharacterized protein YecE (DUF72 family)